MVLIINKFIGKASYEKMSTERHATNATQRLGHGAHGAGGSGVGSAVSKLLLAATSVGAARPVGERNGTELFRERNIEICTDMCCNLSDIAIFDTFLILF